jgi:hypothetical protein
MMMRNIVCVALFVLAAFFLSFSQVKSEPEFKIIQENGIPTAINPDRPVPLPDSPKDMVFTEEFKIGALDGDPNYIFGEFVSFAVDDEGNVYILDWRGKFVRKFDRQGKFLLSFGGSGQGPGEFSSPDGIRYLTDGHIMVFEGESQKFSCFTKEGEVARTGRFQKLMYPPYFGLTNGNIVAMNVIREPEKTVFVFGLFDAKSTLIKSLHQIERKPDPPWPGGNDPDARAKRFGRTFSKVAFRHESVLALDDQEDIYFGYTDRYEIKIFDNDNELEKIIRTELPFLPVEKEDRQAFLEYHLPRDITTWSTMNKALQNKIKRLITFPDKKPAFLDLIPMENDYLMVVRDGNYHQNALIDIFDSTGRFIIEKKLSFPIKNGICGGDRLYTIHEDEDGHQFVRCYVYNCVD